MGTVFWASQTKPLTMERVIIILAFLILTSNCEPDADPQIPIIPYALQPRPYFAPHFLQPYLHLAPYPAVFQQTNTAKESPSTSLIQPYSGPGTPVELSWEIYYNHEFYRAWFAEKYGISNMRMLLIDDDLAKKAENYAAQCTYPAHSQDSESENLYKLTNNKGTVPDNLHERATKSWASESSISVQYEPL